MANIHIPEGYVHIDGRSQVTAQALLKLAEEAGHKYDVATTTNGYIVRKDVAEAFSSSPAKEAEEKAKAEAQAEADRIAKEAEDKMLAEAEKARLEAEEDNGSADLFDPADHTVAEVNEYLANATEEERARVISAEKDGKARASLVENEEGAK